MDRLNKMLIAALEVRKSLNGVFISERDIAEAEIQCKREIYDIVIIDDV